MARSVWLAGFGASLPDLPRTRVYSAIGVPGRCARRTPRANATGRGTGPLRKSATQPMSRERVPWTPWLSPKPWTNAQRFCGRFLLGHVHPDLDDSVWRDLEVPGGRACSAEVPYRVAVNPSFARASSSKCRLSSHAAVRSGFSRRDSDSERILVLRRESATISRET